MEFRTLPRLDGATLVITRPAGTGGAFARRIAACGGNPTRLPGLALRAIEAKLFRPALLAIHARDVVIFTSPAAVRFAFAARASLRSRATTVFAIGAGTARALRRHGIHAVVPERHDSEGLLALPALRALRGQRIVLIGAPGGRDRIAPELKRRGAKVEAIHVYCRVPPRLTRRHFEALAAARDPLITLLSSGEALDNLVALLPPPLIERLRRQVLVVSSARLAGIARANGFEEIVQARSATPADLLAAAAAALARHRL
ncbi:MAG TPA: uroporphyrinogen-III synthase [Rhodanobacteraceae bacterium]|jgi:uroporphyrinogen-III synthase|nr:uroporphyrinogen-III synthase [Rhodanobacteraceae bacterium]